MIETSLKTKLLAASGVTAIIGTRLHPLKLPQSPTLPALTYQRIGGPHTHAMGEASGLAYPIIQLTSWAETYAEAKTLAAAVQAALDGQSCGTGGVAELQNDIDLVDPETGWYYVAADYQIAHQE